MRMHKAMLAALGLIVVLLSGCDVLKQNIATSGPKKYKVEITNAILDIKRDLDEQGEISEGHMAAFRKVMDKWEGEMGGRGSYMSATKAWDAMQLAKSDPANAFKHNRNALGEFDRILETLTTEVK
jgi:hypothetical protein